MLTQGTTESHKAKTKGKKKMINILLLLPKLSPPILTLGPNQRFALV